MRRIVFLLALALLVGACGGSAEPTNPTNPPPTAHVDTTAADTGAPSSVTSASTPGTTEVACEPPHPFGYSLVDLDAVEYITPLGLMIGSHVTPVDHIYFQNFKEPDRWIDVYAPADGVVTHIQHFGAVINDDPNPIDDYRLVMDHGCGVSSILIHIDEVNDAMMTVAPPLGEQASVNVPVVAGEWIGRFTANLDLTVVDEHVTITGLVNPASYVREPWKVHTPDPFAYFSEEVRLQMEELSLRSEPPFAGTFAWDQDGYLVGNWFAEGTNGYGGADPDRYWAGHLSFAYDHIDPSAITISIGTWEGRSHQFLAVGDAPDPAEITVADGPVVYELARVDYWIGDERWDRVSHAKGVLARPQEQVEGAVLVQLLEDRVLLFEAFPGHTGDEITGFSEAATRYER